MLRERRDVGPYRESRLLHLRRNIPLAKDGNNMTPKAREDGLLVQEVGDEVVIYDQERQVIHSLNATAALVWRHCNGQTSISDIAALLYRETQLPANGELVWLALARLGEARLLREQVTRPTDAVTLTRRQLIRKLGLTGRLVLLLPIVASITAPTPAMALTLDNGGGGEEVATGTCASINIQRASCSDGTCRKGTSCKEVRVETGTGNRLVRCQCG
jgi:Coenzyme PQQ synthesis protein D (PqqD)